MHDHRNWLKLIERKFDGLSRPPYPPIPDEQRVQVFRDSVYGLPMALKWFDELPADVRVSWQSFKLALVKRWPALRLPPSDGEIDARDTAAPAHPHSDCATFDSPWTPLGIPMHIARDMVDAEEMDPESVTAMRAGKAWHMKGRGSSSVVSAYTGSLPMSFAWPHVRDPHSDPNPSPSPSSASCISCPPIPPIPLPDVPPLELDVSPPSVDKLSSTARTETCAGAFDMGVSAPATAAVRFVGPDIMLVHVDDWAVADGPSTDFLVPATTERPISPPQTVSAPASVQHGIPLSYAPPVTAPPISASQLRSLPQPSAPLTPPPEPPSPLTTPRYSRPRCWSAPRTGPSTHPTSTPGDRPLSWRRTRSETRSPVAGSIFILGPKTPRKAAPSRLPADDVNSLPLLSWVSRCPSNYLTTVTPSFARTPTDGCKNHRTRSARTHPRSIPAPSSAIPSSAEPPPCRIPRRRRRGRKRGRRGRRISKDDCSASSQSAPDPSVSARPVTAASSSPITVSLSIHVLALAQHALALAATSVPSSMLAVASRALDLAAVACGLSLADLHRDIPPPDRERGRSHLEGGYMER